LQAPHHRSISRRNQGAKIITYSYCQQVGHLLNRCPFVDDKLKQLLKEVMNTHQCVFPTNIIAILNVYVLGTQAMNFNIGHMAIPINY